MRNAELKEFEKKCPCGIKWDRKGNVKEIAYCPVHRAAPALLAEVRKILGAPGAGVWKSLRAVVRRIDVG